MPYYNRVLGQIKCYNYWVLTSPQKYGKLQPSSGTCKQWMLNKIFSISEYVIIFTILPCSSSVNWTETLYQNKVCFYRLIRPDTCPYDGERHSGCACLEDENGRAGHTTFSRIRLNISSLSVNSKWRWYC